MTEENQNTNMATSLPSDKKFKLSLPKLSIPRIQNSKINFKVLGIVFGFILLSLFIYWIKGAFFAAVVNGRPITRFEVIGELERRGGLQTLEGIVNRALIEQEAKSKKITVTNDELNADVVQIEENMKAQGTTLDDALIQQNLTRPQFLEILKANKILEKLIADKVTVSDDEINAYMEANKDFLPKDTTPEDLKTQVLTLLQQQKVESESKALFAGLRAKAKIWYWTKY